MGYQRNCCKEERYYPCNNIQTDIRELRKGLQEVREGICDFEKGCIRKGEEEILKGIIDEEKGLRHLLCDLEDYCYSPCRNNGLLEEGIHDIKQGICEQEHGLAELLDHHECDGIQELQEGICDVEKGIEEVLCALNSCNGYNGCK